MNKLLVSLITASLVSGCATYGEASKRLVNRSFAEPTVEDNLYLKKESIKLAPPNWRPYSCSSIWISRLDWTA
jgi:hypothetical protein